ncbi:sigma-54-dependent Fis family transcriptional regulator [Thioclava sp. BHET1]|nr:sigma-54-dependent Fis family transcriptional regulator [Thioclava sp. BHET1]
MKTNNSGFEIDIFTDSVPIEKPDDPGSKGSILLIDDVASLRGIYESHLQNSGFDVYTAGTANDGILLFRNNPIEIVLLDLMLPDRDGDALIAEMLDLRPRTAIIVITADRSIDRAVNAMRCGALDVLIKPVTEARLTGAIDSARSFALQANPHGGDLDHAPIGAFIGHSPRMQRVYDRIRSAARSTAPVYIWGESGTGKELCAHAIHMLGPRAAAPFITLDCGALPAERLDSELFGHVRGAFPGAVTDKPGALMSANGGSVLLDNVNELPPDTQSKLLRFLQSGMTKPFGADEPIQADVRVLCAAALPAVEAVRLGQMREDLNYRLHVLDIAMPPLREHPEDISHIAQTALARLASEENRHFTTISSDAIAVLEAQSWPGNVRQLMNVLRAAIVMSHGPELTPDMLPEISPQMPCDASPTEPAPAEPQEMAPRTLEEIERSAIETAIERHNGSIPRAANELGVAPSTIYRKRDAWIKKERDD